MTENHPKVKDIEQSIARILKRASGEKDQTVKRDGNAIHNYTNFEGRKFFFNFNLCRYIQGTSFHLFKVTYTAAEVTIS